MEATPTTGIYGLMAEFDTPTQITEAAEKAYAAGYRKMDAYTPFPVEEVCHAMQMPKSKMSLIVLTGGILGGIGGFLLQVWTACVYYPLNIGGRPNFSWPSFIPITFECTVLLGALSAVLGMIFLNDLPLPYHPVFNNPRFNRASQDKFFLCIEADDPKFNAADTRKFLESLHPVEVAEIEK
ncbi:MAG: DUF3341 domain-containing protein [Candidatus Sumerlaeaceae bacterium]|nr:DUF3341 domain-containing protein [Candidatus Sumerlaeaceae bacterium]